MGIGNFRVRLRSATEILATDVGNVKERLMRAWTDQLMLANFPNDLAIPEYFRSTHRQLFDKLTVRHWLGGDRIRATMHRMHVKTAARHAHCVWKLYREYEDFMNFDVTPAADDPSCASACAKRLPN